MLQNVTGYIKIKKMKTIKLIIYTLVIFTVCASCNKQKTNKAEIIKKEQLTPSNLYRYNSETYLQKKDSFRISIDEAYNNVKKYIEKEKTEPIYSRNLYFIYDNYYIFNTYIFLKKDNKYNISGYWVDAITGTVRYIDTDFCANFAIEDWIDDEHRYKFRE